MTGFPFRRRVAGAALAALAAAGAYAASCIVGDPGGRIVTGDGPIPAKSGSGTSAQASLEMSSRDKGASPVRAAWMRACSTALSDVARCRCIPPAFSIILR